MTRQIETQIAKIRENKYLTCLRSMGSASARTLSLKKKEIGRVITVRNGSNRLNMRLIEILLTSKKQMQEIVLLKNQQ